MIISVSIFLIVKNILSMLYDGTEMRIVLKP